MERWKALASHRSFLSGIPQEDRPPLIRINASRVSRTVFERIGPGFPAGSVSGIFDRSVNIEAGDGFLIHIGMEGTPMTPRTTTLPGHEFSAVLRPHLRKGERVAAEDGCIFLPDSRVCLSLRNSPRFEARLDWPAGPLPQVEIRQNLVKIMMGIERLKKGEALPSPMKGYFLAWLAGLEDSRPEPENLRPSAEGAEGISLSMKRDLWAKIDSFLEVMTVQTENHLRDIVRSIIGLGPGLTPSGDDFLAGFTSIGAARRLQGGEIDSRGKNLARILLEEAEGRTTSISEAMFEDASRGEMSEPALLFVSSLLREKDPRKSEAYALEIASIGAFSGEDFLNGAAAALAMLACPAQGPRLEQRAAQR
jgi:hypothetical protein